MEFIWDKVPANDLPSSKITELVEIIRGWASKTAMLRDLTQEETDVSRQKQRCFG